MVRAPYYDKNGVKKGAWSKEEDERLIAYIQRFGHPNWRQLPRLAGLARCGKSCRLRWMNYLRPNLKHGDFSQEEEELFIKLHEQLGNKWSLIAERLPGRTDNEIKNYWHSHLKKCLKLKEKKSELKMKPNSDVSDQRVKTESTQVTEPEEPSIAAVGDNNNNSERSCSMSSEMESCCTEESSSCFDSNGPEESTMKWYERQLSSDFWTEPFILEDANADYYPIFQAEIIRGEINPYVSALSYGGADLLYHF